MELRDKRVLSKIRQEARLVADFIDGLDGGKPLVAVAYS